MLLVAEGQPLCLKRLERVQIEAEFGGSSGPSLGKSLAPVQRRDSSAVASFEAASGTIGPKFLDGFLELALEIARVAETSNCNPPVRAAGLLLMHCTYRPRYSRIPETHRQIMVPGLRAIGRRPTAAREQNK